MKTIKVKVTRDFTYGGRKVLYVICEPTEQDRKDKSKELVKARPDMKKPVLKMLPKGGSVRYESIKEAGRVNEIPMSSISKCINGKQEFAGGYRWKYV